jgi:putative flippase GtrA
MKTTYLNANSILTVVHKQAIKFMLVGVVNTLCDTAIYFFLTRAFFVFSTHLVLAKALSFLAATVSSLVLNRYWTFSIRTPLRVGEVMRFYAGISLSLLVNVASMTLLLSIGMYDLLALLITTIFTFAVGFTVSKLWIFKNSDIRL